MSALSVRLPASLHKHAKRLAEQEGISVNQLISTALAEKLSALATEEYLRSRAARVSRKKFDAALARVADVEADAFDRVPEPTSGPARSGSRRPRRSAAG